MDALYMIHANSGNLMMFRKYGNLEFNEDLISGFLTALKDFSSEVTGGKGKMKNLDMGDTNILLVNEEGVLVAAALNKRDDESIAYKALKEMLAEFLKEFGDELVDWKGNLKIFLGYEAKIDKMLKNGKIAEKELYVPVLKKKIPKQLVDMGALTKEEFSFANFINGQDTAEVIAEKEGIPLEKVNTMLDKLKSLGLIKHNKI
ncbi:MAG TPA: hypothetical protein VKM55_02825 [Candidatus Lokiarchaeia archaeon]|nr:hypothetical protein [Candidatus Lokiarchaeia archaeon]